LFIAYAHAMKHKKQLVWSRGMRDRLGLGPQRDDQELAEELESEGRILLRLTPEEWRLVVGNDARAELLDVAATGNVAAVWRFLGDL